MFVIVAFPGHVHLFYGLFDLILYIPDNIVFPGHVHLFFGTTEVNYKCTKICLLCVDALCPTQRFELCKGFWFCLLLYVPVNSYGHVRTVSSPNHTFFLPKLD